MLQIQHIKKEYQTGSLVQKALDDVSLNIRTETGIRTVTIRLVLYSKVTI